jgi:type II secretory pathway pseudopilin PulG
MLKNKTFTAFTLAEVLITLGIIGVVMVMTIPTLLSRTAEKECLIKLKKEYSALAQATIQLQAQNDTINFTDSGTLEKDYSTVLKFVKEGPQNTLFPSSYYYYKSSTTQDWSINTYVSGVLIDGSIWRFVSSSANCTASHPSSITNLCGGINIDVNGTKPPNMYGKDLFSIDILKKGDAYVLAPKGGPGDNYTCDPSKTTESGGCTVYALKTDNPEDMP